MSDVFREVDEAVRQDQLLAIWKRYRVLIIVAVAAVVVGVGGFQTWQSLELQKKHEAANTFASAVALVRAGDTEASLAALAEQSNPAEGGFGTLAAFAQARLLWEAGRDQEALALIDEIAASQASGKTLQEAAIILSVSRQVDSGDAAALQARLAPLTAEGGSFRGQALELSAVLAFKQGDRVTAKELLQAMAEVGASPAMRARAQQLIEAYKL